MRNFLRRACFVLTIFIIFTFFNLIFFVDIVTPKMISVSSSFGFEKVIDRNIFSLLGYSDEKNDYDAYVLDLHIENNSPKNIDFYEITNPSESNLCIVPENKNELSLELTSKSETDTDIVVLLKKDLSKNEIEKCLSNIKLNIRFYCYSEGSINLIDDIKNQTFSDVEVKEIPVIFPN